jgi:hypothetical protein
MLLVREGLAAEERYGFVDGTGAVPDPFDDAEALEDPGP